MTWGETRVGLNYTHNTPYNTTVVYVRTYTGRNERETVMCTYVYTIHYSTVFFIANGGHSTSASGVESDTRGFLILCIVCVFRT